MKPAIVGWLVGFLVGKSGLPDMSRPNGMCNLDPDCRECRVVIGEETLGGFQRVESLKSVQLRGLE